MSGHAFKSGDYVSSPNTLKCRMSNVRRTVDFDLTYNPKLFPDKFAAQYAKYLLRHGDVIIAMTNMAAEPKNLGNIG